LGVESYKGISFPDFFGDNATHVLKTIQGAHGQKTLIRQLNLTSQVGANVCVHAEIAPLFIDGKYRGAYATLTDMSPFTELQKRVFEKSPLGIIRVNRNMEVIYANQAALDMTGAKRAEGWELFDIVPDDENRAILGNQFERRMKGASDEYVIEIKRVDDGRTVPVRIAATPEFDNLGNMVGALGIVRSLEYEQASEAFHRHIETSYEWEELLTKIADETARIIPYDLFLVSIYTRDLRHACIIFDYPKKAQFSWPKRWLPLSPELVRWMKEEGTHPVGNLKALLNEPRWQYLRPEKSVQLLINRGIQSFVRYPVLRPNNLMATLTLMSRRPNAFTEVVERLKALPIGEAINTAIYYRTIKEQQFRFELVKRISNSASVDDVMDTIVQSLVDHYGWQDVAIFRVDDAEKRFILRAQAHANSSYKYDESLALNFDEGILGEAYRSNKTINIGNVLDRPNFVRANERTMSELCIPISLGGKIRWLLNVEDEAENAFSEDEKGALEEIVDEVNSVVGHLFAHFFRDEFIASAPDAIFVTDRKGQIIESNEAAANLLGNTSIDEIVGRELENFLAEEDKGTLDFHAKKIRDRYRFINAQKKPVEVFITGGELPEDFGCKVFCAKDLSLIRRVEELEAIRDMFREITTQTRTPVSLLFTWLRRLRERIPHEAELLEKAICQLRKIELTYERLVLYDAEDGVIPYDPLRLDIPSVISTAVAELPRADRDKVEVHALQSLPHFHGDLFQLTFIFQTILAYLLRFVPVDEKIKINVSDVEPTLQIRITGFTPAPRTHLFGGDSGEVFVKRAHLDLGLGETTIRQFIKDHNGSYESNMVGEEEIEFLITLPTIKRKG
jgi:PAS domain S-box-containing protein